MERDFDIVVFGATGFVGKLICEYLAGRADASLRIAIAGRSKAKLVELVHELPQASSAWGIVVADSFDRQSLDDMTSRTKVVLTTVGPYAKYGRDLVASCAAHGTHYADLTGETLFVRACADEFDALARENGAKIVNSCGFDSVPSDLAVWLAAREAARANLGKLTKTDLVVRSLKGGVSGGTVDSLRVQLAEMREDPSLYRAVTDWYALSPDRKAEPKTKQPSDSPRPHVDQFLGGWIAPFIMAPFNTRLVRRTNALLDWEYGRDFSYGEVCCFGFGPRGAAMAHAMAGGLAAVMFGMSQPLTRGLLDRLLPQPGEGPSETTRRNGRFRVEVIAHTDTGAQVSATVAAKGDPGYAATSVMIAESALSLAQDDLGDRAGVLTPAVAMGQHLVDRLVAAGFTAEAAIR